MESENPYADVREDPGMTSSQDPTYVPFIRQPRKPSVDNNRTGGQAGTTISRVLRERGGTVPRAGSAQTPHMPASDSKTKMMSGLPASGSSTRGGLTSSGSKDRHSGLPSSHSKDRNGLPSSVSMDRDAIPPSGSKGQSGFASSGSDPRVQQRRGLTPMRPYGAAGHATTPASPIPPVPASATSSSLPTEGTRPKRRGGITKILGGGRGRSDYRPNTLSKHLEPPLPSGVPPLIIQGGLQRRSQSAPPEGLEMPNALGITTGVELVRTKSGGDERVVLTGLGEAGLLVRDGPGQALATELGLEVGTRGFEADSAEFPPRSTPSAALKRRSTPASSLPSSGNEFVMAEPEVVQPHQALRHHRHHRRHHHHRREGSGADVSSQSSEEDMSSFEGAEPALIPKARTQRMSKPSRFGPPAVLPRPSATLESDQYDQNHGMFEDERYPQAKELRPSQNRAIARNEAANNKALSKLIQEEGRIGRETLAMAVGELDDLQKTHRQGMRDEAKAINTHGKTLSNYTKLIASLENMRKRYQALEGKVEVARTELQQADDSVQDCKDKVWEARDRTQEKKEEVEVLRKQLGIDERGRAAHLEELKGMPASPSFENAESAERQKPVRGKTRFGL